jgi:hypothetical protein
MCSNRIFWLSRRRKLFAFIIANICHGTLMLISLCHFQKKGVILWLWIVSKFEFFSKIELILISFISLNFSSSLHISVKFSSKLSLRENSFLFSAVKLFVIVLLTKIDNL